MARGFSRGTLRTAAAIVSLEVRHAQGRLPALLALLVAAMADAPDLAAYLVRHCRRPLLLVVDVLLDRALGGGVSVPACCVCLPACMCCGSSVYGIVKAKSRTSSFCFFPSPALDDASPRLLGALLRGLVIQAAQELLPSDGVLFDFIQNHTTVCAMNIAMYHPQLENQNDSV